MSTQIEQVDPWDLRDQIVDLMWAHRHWPGDSREEYFLLFDWRYSALADGRPVSWVVRDEEGPGIIAHIAAFPRRLRIGSTVLRCVVPGDALVHETWRTGTVGARLLRIPRTLVQQGEYDVALGFSTPAAFQIQIRMGYQDLGPYYELVDIRRTSSMLRRRLGRGGIAVAPFVDLALFSRRLTRHGRWRLRGGLRGLRVDRADPSALTDLDYEIWRAPDNRVVGHDTPQFLMRRFFGPGPEPHELLVIKRCEGGSVVGFGIAASGTDSGTIVHCASDATVLNLAMALAALSDHLVRSKGRVAVPLIGARVERELRDLGFFFRGPLTTGEPVRAAAYWSPDHPQANAFSDLDCWSLLRGAAEF